jgi:putative membrane protein
MNRDTPPPRDLAIAARGLLMGGADIIPGVSGGTMALILGIYDRLVTAISHVDATLVGHLRTRHWRAAADHIDLRFLVALGCGILAGIALLGTAMNYLLLNQRQFTFAAFFGLIASSSILVGRMVQRWSTVEIVLLVAGGLFALWLVRLPALSHPPEALWYVFVCGVVGICAMILPGISGAFLLLILGKYEDLTHIIKQTLKLQITAENVATVAVFAAGCAIGLISFAKVLRWLLGRHEPQTMAVLCGFMIGSLYKLWPFQRDTTPEIEKFKHKIFEHIPPAEISMDGRFWLTLGIALAAGLFVLVLDRVTHVSEHVPPLEPEEPEHAPL